MTANSLQAGGYQPRHYDVATVGMQGFVRQLGESAGKKLQQLHSEVNARRTELRHWDKLALEFEKAFTHEQTWIHPLQGVRRMRQTYDGIVNTGGLSESKLWPSQCVMLARRALNGTHAQGMRFFRKDDEATEDGRQKDVKWVNEALLRDGLALVDEDGWDLAGDLDGVAVWRKLIKHDRKFAGVRTGKSAQFVVVKARGTIDAPVDKLFEVFQDNEKAKEYNEFCKQVYDLEQLDPRTKVTYSETGKPWSRDFVTRVYYHGDDESVGGKVIVSRGEEHEGAPKKKGVTRMDLTIGANIMRPLPGDPSKTELTVLTHVNPGGLASTHLGVVVTNRLSAESPREFIKRLNEVASGRGPAPPEPKKGLRKRLAERAERRAEARAKRAADRGGGIDPRVAGGFGVTAAAAAGVSLLSKVVSTGLLRRLGRGNGGGGGVGDMMQPEFVVEDTARLNAAPA